MAKAARRYTAKLKFRVVLEALKGERTPAQIAKTYGVHVNSVKLWTEQFIEHGPEVFDKQGSVAEYERRIAELERLVGRKEVELALLKNFLGQST